MTKTIEIIGAWDKTHPDPKRNYGVHGVEMRFYLKGDKGAIQFVLYTNWMLPKNRVGISKLEIYPLEYWMKPQPADIGYHSPKSMYEGQVIVQKECHVINGPCYYDGSSLNADRYFEYLIEGGTELLWSKMEEYYNETFNNV